MKRRWFTFVKAIAVIIGLMFLATQDYDPSLAKTHSWSVMLRAQVGIAMIVGAGGTYLYRVRYSLPAIYGALEIAIGFFVALYVLNIAVGAVSNKGNAAIATVAALYVIVRGLDNIYRSLKKPGAIRGWNRVFFDQDTDAKL